jgi:hypothetical protein
LICFFFEQNQRAKYKKNDEKYFLFYLFISSVANAQYTIKGTMAKNG